MLFLWVVHGRMLMLFAFLCVVVHGRMLFLWVRFAHHVVGWMPHIKHVGISLVHVFRHHTIAFVHVVRVHWRTLGVVVLGICSCLWHSHGCPFMMVIPHARVHGLSLVATLNASSVDAGSVIVNPSVILRLYKLHKTAGQHEGSEECHIRHSLQKKMFSMTKRKNRVAM